jgi:Zn-dependent protease with chaperone function
MNRPWTRSGRVLLAAGLSLGLAAPAAAGMKLPGGGGGGFSVSGKKGPFLKQVAGRNLGGAGAGSMGLASDSSARGEFRAARLHMPLTEAAVSAFVGKLDAQWPYAKPLPIKIYILGLDNYGAESMPDGSIVIPFGLIDQAQTDDELAFVLGHELGHIRLNHFARNAEAQQRQKQNSQMVDLFVTGASMAHGAMSGGGLNLDTDVAARRGNAMNDAARLFLQTMVEPNWSRDEEDEADATGFDLSQADTYDSEAAAATVFDKLQADADRRAALSESLAQGMQESMKSVLSTSSVSSVAMGGGAGLGGGIKQGLIAGAGRGVMAWMASGKQEKHRPPAQRKKGIADYSADAYPSGLPIRDEQHAWLDQVRASKEYVQAKVVVEAVKVSVQDRTDNKPDAALAEMDKALHTAFRTSALVSNEAARGWADKGDFVRSEQYFAVADQSPDQTIDGYRDHARMLIRAGQYERARSVAAAGTSRFAGDDKPFLPALILVSFNTSQHDQGVAYLQRCVTYDDQTLKNECSLAATNPSDARQYASLTPAEKAKVDQAVAQAAGKDAKTQQANKPTPLNVLSGLGHLKIPGT